MKKNTHKTISELLNECKVGDIISDGVRSWKVVDDDFDGAIVARPYRWKKKDGASFELWSVGIESIAYIPGLHKVS